MQAREASRTREIAEMADLVAGADQMRKMFARGIPAIEETIFNMQSAAQRWSLEVMEKELSREISEWPELIGSLGVNAFRLQTALIAKLKNRPEDFVDVAAFFFHEGMETLLGAEPSDEELLQARSRAVKAFGEDLYLAIASLSRATRYLRRATRIRALSLPEGLQGEGMPSLAQLMAQQRKAREVLPEESEVGTFVPHTTIRQPPNLPHPVWARLD